MLADAPVTVDEALALQPSTDFTRRLPLRPLTLPLFAEPLGKRIAYGLVAVGIAGAYLYLLLSFFVPATPGVDENGYLVGGKQMALTGSPGLEKLNPFQFHGLMWVMTRGDKPAEQLKVYPKYPLGLPLLNAIPLKIDWQRGKVWALYLSPVCTALALLMMYGLAAELAGPFMGLLAMLLLGVNYVTLILAELPLSHAPDLLFVTGGFWLLLRWWRGGSPLFGAAAGFVIGYAAAIRYSEGLLILPLGFVVLTTIRWRAAVLRTWWWRPIVAFAVGVLLTAVRLKLANRWTPLWITLGLLITAAALFPWRDRRRIGLIVRAGVAGLIVAVLVQAKTPLSGNLNGPYLVAALTSRSMPDVHQEALRIELLSFAFVLTFLYAPCVLRRSLLPILCWLMPVLWLIAFNYFAMGTITGYDTTREREGFRFATMKGQWEYAAQQLYDVGGFVILPLAVLGLITIYRWRWQLATALVLWLVPTVLLYCAYYWGNGLGGVGYARFFASIQPVLVLAAVWFLRHGGWTRFNESPGRRGAVALPLAAGAIVAIAAGFGLRNALPMLARAQVVALNLKYSADRIVETIPKHSVVFTQQRVSMDAMDNWLQFVGDFELYHALMDRSQWKVFREGDPDSPTPRDRRYFEYMKKLLDGMTDVQIVGTQHGYMRAALSAPSPRGVYAVLPTNWVGPFATKFINGSPLEWKKIASWTEPVPPLVEVSPTPLMPKPRGAVNRVPIAWTIWQITLKPPASTTQSAGSN